MPALCMITCTCLCPECYVSSPDLHDCRMQQVLSAVLLWNFGLTGQLAHLRSKVERDFVPTLINGEYLRVG